MIPDKSLTDVFVSILNGELESAEQQLQQLKPEATAEKRRHSHYQGLVLFHRGEVLAALQHLEFTRQYLGSNVMLLRDLMICQYHLQDMSGFRANLSHLESLIVEHKDKLSPTSRFECELMIGKALEEEARLLPALEFYERALLHTETSTQRIRGLLQKARWHALYEPNRHLSEFYRELISVSRKGLTQDSVIELEHSLMLIELRLIGADHAHQRLLQIPAVVAEIDQRLMYFDFIEGCITQDLTLSPAVLEKMNSFKKFDPFEEFIRKLVQGSLEAAAKIHQLSLLASQLPWASYLRLLCLAANMESSHASRLEINRKIQLIIRSLDPRSQGLWNLRLKQALQPPEIRLEFSSQRRSVLVQGRLIDLTKKKMGMQLVEGLAGKAELSVDEAIHLLWQTSFSPEHYHRLRMGVHRLNALINKITGLGKIIEVDSQLVRLRPEVKIRQADEAFSTEMVEL